MAGFVGEIELDQCSGFEGALKWMEEGGVSICLGFCALDVFQLDGGREGVGNGGRLKCVAICIQATHTHMVETILMLLL